MSENTQVNTQKVTEQKLKISESNSEISMEHIFAEMKAIREQSQYLNNALVMLETVKSEGPGDIGAQAKANSIADIVKCRETTNQQLLKFYEKIYSDIRRDEKAKNESQSLPQKQKEFLKFVHDTTIATAGATPEHSYAPGVLPDFEKLWKTLYLGE